MLFRLGGTGVLAWYQPIESGTNLLSKVPRPKYVIYIQVEHDSIEQWVCMPLCDHSIVLSRALMRLGRAIIL